MVSYLITIEAAPLYKQSKQSLLSVAKPKLLACSDIDDVWAILKVVWLLCGDYEFSKTNQV